MHNGILHSSENEQVIAASNNVETPCKHTEQVPSGLVALPLTWVHCWRHWRHTFLLPASFPRCLSLICHTHSHGASYGLIFLNHVGVTCLWESPLRGASYCHAHCLMDPRLRAGPSDTIYCASGPLRNSPTGGPLHLRTGLSFLSLPIVSCWQDPNHTVHSPNPDWDSLPPPAAVFLICPLSLRVLKKTQIFC